MFISREELQEVLNYKEAQYELRVETVLDYIKQPEIAPIFINQMIRFMKENKNFNHVSLREVFFNELRKHISHTETCPNEFSFLKIANHAFMMSRFSVLAISLYNAGKMLLEVKEAEQTNLETSKVIAVVEKQMNTETPPIVKHTVRKRKKKVLTPEQEEEKLRKQKERYAKQAQVMREAKARKKLEQ